MMGVKEQVILKLKGLTNYKYVELLTKGNAAIWSALQLAKGEVLIPEEGGWLTYPTYPKKLNLGLEEVKCLDAVLDLTDLRKKVKTADLLLYANPGGYHAEQPMLEIYDICQRNGCLVVLDVAGGIGTKLCDGKYADIIIGSFGRWKPVNAQVGGFVATNNSDLFERMKPSFKLLDGKENYQAILGKLDYLDQRIDYLLGRRDKVIEELTNLNLKIFNKDHLGFVVVVGYEKEQEKERIINYCNNSELEYTECPRYIRLNKKAISIEIKRL